MDKCFHFDGSMSRAVLNNYLSRAVTHVGIGYYCDTYSKTFEDDLRMLKNMGAKFIGRAALVFNDSVPDSVGFPFAKERIARGHEVDPQFIFQAGIFECISRAFVESTPVPAYVFETFGLPGETRCFSFADMKMDDLPANYWENPSHSVPDITKREAQMWFFYRAAEYIKAGCEAVHLGQIHVIGKHDKDLSCWKFVTDKIRAFAKVHARRHHVLLDGHTIEQARYSDIVDYNAFPIRPKEIPSQPMKCLCEENYLDSMFNETDGQFRPFLVEFDNWGYSDKRGQPTLDDHHVWGYDEITWFSLQTDAYRKEFLNYVTDWVKARYPEGWVQMPSFRNLDGTEKLWYKANTRSDACPEGFSDEETIKAIFARI